VTQSQEIATSLCSSQRQLSLSVHYNKDNCSVGIYCRRWRARENHENNVRYRCRADWKSCQNYTGARSKKKAIEIAMKEFLRAKRRKELSDLVGNYEGFEVTLKDLKKMRKDSWDDFGWYLCFSRRTLSNDGCLLSHSSNKIFWFQALNRHLDTFVSDCCWVSYSGWGLSALVLSNKQGQIRYWLLPVTNKSHSLQSKAAYSW